MATGYCDCACRDCFDIAIGDPKTERVLCGDCEAAGCDASGDCDCERDDAYGGEVCETCDGTGRTFASDGSMASHACEDCSGEGTR